MATSAELKQSPGVWVPPEALPLDEAVWQAWLAKRREADRRSGATLLKAATWVLIAGLVVAALLWTNFSQR